MADDPVAAGELGSGPSPYQLLASALAACTTITLILYIERKGCEVKVRCTAVGHRRDEGCDPSDVFKRRIGFEGEPELAQRSRLLEVADR